jgi:non-specific serine/threonine protein kinase
MLDPEQQQLFRRLSVFRGGFTLAALAAVSGTDDEFEALDALSQLVDKSLVRTIPTGQETRYQLLEPLRQYAAARITAEEAAAAGAEHGEYFRDLAEQAAAELHGSAQLQWLARLEAEHDNLRAALAFGIASDRVEIAQRIAAALMWFWVIRRHVAEAMEWYDRVLGADDTPTQARTWALAQAGFIRPMVRLDDLDGCLALLREAQERFVDLDDD